MLGETCTFQISWGTVLIAKRLGLLLLIILVLATPWAFAYGPLFPWSIVKPGYEKLSLRRADIFYAKGSKLDPAYLKIDDLMTEAEQFHQLPFSRRIRVIACSGWSDFYRFSPLTRSHA